MDVVLNETELRVIGSLIEKQMATPEYYPLTLNALINACNQTSNRDPVMTLDETTVVRTLESLRDRNLVHTVRGSDARVPRYRQVLTESLKLMLSESAVMCVLMLRRAAQTSGEIKTRATRLFDFDDLAEVEATLERLIERGSDDRQALIVKLPRQTGQKEVRFAHLLSGPVDVEAATLKSAPLAFTSLGTRLENERIARLETEVEGLRQEVADLRQQLEDFRKQFE